MNDQSRTKHDLIQELVSLRKRIAELGQYESDRKQTEEALRESEYKYKSLIENIPDIIFIIIDLEGKITFVSKRAKEILGYENEETINRSIFNFIPEEAHQSTIEKLQKGMEGEKIKHVQLPVTAKSGKKLFFDFSFSRIYKDGVVVGAQGTAVDVTERKRAEEALRQSEEKYRTILESFQEGYFEVDLKGNFTFCNDSMFKIIGYSKEELLGMNYRVYTNEEIAKKVYQEFNNVFTTGQPSKGFDWPYIRKDGTQRYIEASIILRKDSSGKPIGFKGMVRDVTERKHLEKKLQESEANYRQLFDNAPAAIYQVDFKSGKFLKANDLICEYIGCNREEITSISPYDFLTEESKKLFLERLEKMVLGIKVPETVEYEVFNKKGRRWFLQLHTKHIYDAEGHVIAADVVAHDITERKQIEDELREREHRYQELSTIDDLTQLYNSRHFHAQLEKEIERSNRYDQPLTLLLLDLDKFKDFNDKYGHVEGDRVLLRLGRVIKRCLRETDSAYRYGGEEFTIILPMTTSEEGIVTAQRIQAELRKEAFSPVLGKKIYMTVSIGLSQYNLQEEIKAFINRADKLMYQAKKNGRNRICPES
jgi:diguanylate cyclase (GGDEF)-like protein/PAS domain S-box-containing protein